MYEARNAFNLASTDGTVLSGNDFSSFPADKLLKCSYCGHEWYSSEVDEPSWWFLHNITLGCDAPIDAMCSKINCSD